MQKVTLLPHRAKGWKIAGFAHLVCPKSLFVASEEMNEVGYLPPLPPDEAKCTACGNCMIYCPDFALWSRPRRDGKEEEANG